MEILADPIYKDMYFCIHLLIYKDREYEYKIGIKINENIFKLALLEPNNTLWCVLEPLIKSHLSSFDDVKQRKE